MKCARCSRNLKYAAATSGGKPYGPQCSRKMGLAPGKREPAAVVLPGQMALFQTEVATS